jgi:antitoxin ParD1/3/4
MPRTQALNITLSADLARMVKEKVASGGYESESEVVREGLRALQAQDAAVEEWLRTEGVARYEAYHRDPGRGRPIAEVFARLRQHHDEQSAKRRG